MREAGILITLNVPNNFPQHPVRNDGPFLVWLGMVKDDKSLKSNFGPIADEPAKFLGRAGLLRGEPELLIMEPTHRSRLRWLERPVSP